MILLLWKDIYCMGSLHSLSHKNPYKSLVNLHCNVHFNVVHSAYKIHAFAHTHIYEIYHMNKTHSHARFASKMQFYFSTHKHEMRLVVTDWGIVTQYATVNQVLNVKYFNN